MGQAASQSCASHSCARGYPTDGTEPIDLIHEGQDDKREEHRDKEYIEEETIHCDWDEDIDPGMILKERNPIVWRADINTQIWEKSLSNADHSFRHCNLSCSNFQTGEAAKGWSPVTFPVSMTNMSSAMNVMTPRSLFAKTSLPVEKIPPTMDPNMNSSTLPLLIGGDLDEPAEQSEAELQYRCDKTFQIQPEGSFPRLRSALVSRGWIENEDPLSRFWDLKFAISKKMMGDYITDETEHYVVQKYVERPLLIQDHKFDIRQWVLVTSWQPLKLWFYDDAYLRICMNEYDTRDLEDRLAHLTNVCLAKEQFESTEDAMWHSEDFETYLQLQFGEVAHEDVGEKRNPHWKGVQLQMQQFAQLALLSCKDVVGDRRGSFELIGFDFLVDEDLKVWLLEINSSPMLGYSTETKCQITRQMFEDLAKVVVDIEGFGRQDRGLVQKSVYSEKFDSGRWILLEPEGTQHCTPNEYGNLAANDRTKITTSTI